MWRPDLSVWRFPTDGPKLTEFLSRVEGRAEELGYTPLRGEGLLIVARPQAEENGNDLLVVRRRHVLDKEYFQHVWPAGDVVDKRDTMHERGWTYFTVEGRINGEEVRGQGRMPFVYAAAREHSPWLRLNVGNRLKFVDSGEEALVYEAGQVAASYEGGSLFKGLARPWMGLHSVDTVRRDAAEEQVPFESKYEGGEEKAVITLFPEEGRLIYTIDIKKDVIEKVEVTTSDGKKAELSFSYLQDLEQAAYEFTQPRITRSYGTERRASPGMRWLVQMLNDY
jgi:hypothetical protein